MKKHLPLILLFLSFPSLVFAEAVPLSDLLTAADDYWRTSTPQRPVLIQGGKINSSPYVPVPSSSTMGLVGFASGAAALGGLAFYQQTGKDPATALIDGAYHVFQPAYLAFSETFVSPESFPAAAAQFVGVEASIGAALSDIADYLFSHPGDFPALDSALGADGVTGVPTADSPIGLNSLVDTPTGVKKVNSNWLQFQSGTYYHSAASKISADSHGATPTKIGVSSDFSIDYYLSGDRVYRVVNIRQQGPDVVCDIQRAYLAAASGSPTVNFSPGALNEPALVAALENSPHPETQQELSEVIIELPSTQVQIATAVPQVATAQDLAHPSISPQALEQFFAQNSSQVANKALEVINDPASTPQEIAAAQAASNAAEQTAQQADSLAETPPETFPDVPLSGFEEPYNPGPFDIPDRFDTFLSNVASTGLFSLPSGYFNSLPGGGSPTYTIEAGQYGTHTVDLSETMGTGLAVLKTVLLLCFAFLSVRVVVLKR